MAGKWSGTAGIPSLKGAGFYSTTGNMALLQRREGAVVKMLQMERYYAERVGHMQDQIFGMLSN